MIGLIEKNFSFTVNVNRPRSPQAVFFLNFVSILLGRTYKTVTRLIEYVTYVERKSIFHKEKLIYQEYLAKHSWGENND